MSKRTSYSHIINENIPAVEGRLSIYKSVCGRNVSIRKMDGIWRDGKNFSFTKPLCPKCAAARLIAETPVAK